MAGMTAETCYWEYCEQNTSKDINVHFVGQWYISELTHICLLFYTRALPNVWEKYQYDFVNFSPCQNCRLSEKKVRNTPLKKKATELFN
jgi:hypothetical protein